MANVFDKAAELGIVPVLSIPDVSHAVPLVKGLAKGGLPLIEVMFRTDAALDSIREIAEKCPEICVGAGTVVTIEQADAAMAAGAKFLVSPGFDPELVKHCVEKGYDILPGIATPTEIQNAVKFGLKYLKFFPAPTGGGTEALDMFSGPYPGVKFVVTGGMGADTIAEYLDVPCVAAVGGTFPAPMKMILDDDADGIAEVTRRAVAEVFGFRIAHIGINSENEAEAKKTAETLARIFGLEVIPHDPCYFAGSLVEVMKGQGRGRLGHIAIGTRDIVRAAKYVERAGIALDWENAKYYPDGSLMCVFFRDDIAGFAFHLLAGPQKPKSDR